MLTTILTLVVMVCPDIGVCPAPVQFAGQAALVQSSTITIDGVWATLDSGTRGIGVSNDEETAPAPYTTPLHWISILAGLANASHAAMQPPLGPVWIYHCEEHVDCWIPGGTVWVIGYRDGAGNFWKAIMWQNVTTPMIVAGKLQPHPKSTEQ